MLESEKNLVHKVSGYLVGICIMFAGFFLCLCVVLLACVFRYNAWEQENTEMLNSFSAEANPVEVSEAYELLNAFATSPVQKETMSLDCDQVNILFDEIIKENWQNSGINVVGVVCKERGLDVYVFAWDRVWFVFKVWQRVDGDVDFYVYDVLLGPLSTGVISQGIVTEQLSCGVDDALNLVLDGGFSGRVIEEVYLESSGVRIVGVLK
ncbi:MAG: hypothetical protein U9Q67_02925 [Patescibacteria group bacterium]|nr:hypothetical protein [Patescibacteria group bacterium]